MPLTFHLRQLEEKNLHLKGDLPAAELEVGNLDELIHTPQPLAYDLEVQGMEDAILVTGTLNLPLACECARCLKPYADQIRLENWACHLPMAGDEKVPVINDCVDLTPYLREDIVLAFPQHPLCETGCAGLNLPRTIPESGAEKKSSEISSAWAELNKLKL